MNNAIVNAARGTPVFIERLRPRLLYPALIVAAVSVTLLSLTGIAAITGHLPGANAEPAGAVAPKPAERSAALCPSCGTVESVRLIERKGEGSGLGAVAGGVAGALIGNQIGHGGGRAVMTVAGGAGGAYLGNEIEKNTKKSSAYQIRISMADGSLRTLTQREVPSVRAGDRVRLSNGVIAEVL